MGNEIRNVIYDTELMIEAYNFQGIMQKFPNHFHEYYVIGFIEKGQRYLLCKNTEYTIENGDLILFNPYDNHTCEQIDGGTLDYRCLNIQPDVMKKLTYEVTGSEHLPYFTQNIIFRSDLINLLKALHLRIMSGERDFGKEETLLFIISQLIDEYTEQDKSFSTNDKNMRLRDVCEYLENNYMNSISLDDLCGITGLSKYYLIRSFTKQKGISPYCYLETIRINNAKKFLEEGIAPVEVALMTGFTDQSHFTNKFKELIGLTPKQYMNIFK